MVLRNVQRLALFVLAVVYLSACAGGYKMEASVSPINPCEHLDDPYSEYMCQFLEASNQFTPAIVAAETLVVHTTDGRTIRLAMPNRTDAIFLSQSAVETFLLRHYDATNKARAAKLRHYLDSAYHH